MPTRSARLPRRARSTTARQLCRAELERFRAAAASGDAAHRRLHPGSAAVLRGRRRARRRDLPSSICARPPAGRTTPRRPGRRWRRCSRPPPSRCPTFRSSASTAKASILIYGRDERAIEAGKLLDDHLDVTVLIARPNDLTPPRVTEFPVVQGHDPHRPRAISAPSRSWSTTTPQPRRRRAARLTFGAGARRRGVALRHRARSVRRRAAVSAPDLRDGYLRADPGDPAAVLRAVLKARDLVGTFDKPRYITFTERSLRAFALEDRRLPPLPRSLPDRRDHAGRRSRRDRRRRSAPAAANAPPPARPAPPPTRCRRPMR